MTVNKVKTIFFLDVDGTLINSYTGPNVNDPSIFINKIQSNGSIVGLNSNRSIEDLLPIANKFGINGPIIGENGAFIYFPKDKKTKILISSSKEEIMIKIKKRLPQIIYHYFKKLNLKSTFKTVDTVKYLSIPNSGDSFDTDVLLINNRYRKYTISAHLQALDCNVYRPAKEYISSLANNIREKLGPNLDITVHGHPEYCNILIYSNSCSKKTGIINLAKLYPDFNLVAIGDETGDYEMIRDIGSFYTVLNANSDVKKLAKYTSNLGYTQGVFDIISKVLNNKV